MPAARHRLATLLGVVGIGLWASETVLLTFTGGLPALELVALSFAVAAVGAFLVTWVGGQSPLVGFRQPWGAWLLAVPSLLIYHAFLYHAVQRAPATEAALLQGCTPLLIVLGSVALRGERVRWWHLGGAASGLAGVVALVGDAGAMPTVGSFDPYLLMVGIMAGLWGVYSLLTRRREEVPAAAMGLVYLAVALVAAGLHLLFETWVVPTPSGWLAVAAIGLLPTGLAIALWNHGVKHGDLQALGACAYLEPLIGALLVVAIGRGEAGWALLWAGLLIVGGAVLAARGLWDRRLPGEGAAPHAPRQDAGRPGPAISP